MTALPCARWGQVSTALCGLAWAWGSEGQAVLTGEEEHPVVSAVVALTSASVALTSGGLCASPGSFPDGH